MSSNDHSAKIATPATARMAVKPMLAVLEKAPLPLPLPPLPVSVLLLEAPVPVGVPVEPPDGEPDAEEDEFRVFLASCTKAAKVLLPIGGALIAPTIPWPQ